MGGVLLEFAGPEAIFLSNAVLTMVWFIISSSMANPENLSSYLLRVAQLSTENARALVDQLSQVQGVAEAVVIPG